MNLIVYQKYPHQQIAFQHFLLGLKTSQMHYLASDLLKFGLSPSDISFAVKRAMIVCRMAGKEMTDHFYAVYTFQDGEQMKDCKLSSFGYALVMLNADIRNKKVAKWQVEVINRAFGTQ